MCIKRKETNYISQMSEYVRTFMIGYLAEHPEDGDDVVPIFTEIKSNLMQYPERTIVKEMRKNGLNMEAAVLNIMQNFALVHIEPQSAASFTCGDDAAHRLYKAINDLKLQKKYIGPAQHKENEMIGVKAGLNSPFGRWL